MIPTFHRVTVAVTPADEKLVEWRIAPSARFQKLPLSFYVECAFSGGEWRRLNTEEPVTEYCWYIDPIKRQTSLADALFYRVVATDTENEYASQPAGLYGVLNSHDWLIVRDIIRQEYLRLKKYAGISGYLFRRRDHGTRCPVCLDHDVKESGNTRCAICFGTGVKYGYFNAIPFWMDLTGTESRKEVQQPFGVVDNRPRTGRCVAYPTLETYDIWMDGQRNRRYVIRQLQIVAELKGQPIVYQTQLLELPDTAIEYQIPQQREEASSSSTVGVSAEQGWRQGISLQGV